MVLALAGEPRLGTGNNPAARPRISPAPCPVKISCQFSAMAMAGSATGAPPPDFAGSGCGLASSENQKKLCGPSVRKYGASVMTGNFVRPNSSTGTMLLERRQIQFHRLGEAGEVGDHQNGFLFVAQDVAQNLVVVRLEKFAFALAERAPAFAQRQHPPHPPEQRMRIGQLRLHVARLRSGRPGRG